MVLAFAHFPLSKGAVKQLSCLTSLPLSCGNALDMQYNEDKKQRLIRAL